MTTWKTELLMFIILASFVSRTTTDEFIDQDDLTNPLCKEWISSIHCRVPCSYFHHVCLGHYTSIPQVGIENTHLTCTWTPIPGVTDYAIMLQKNKFSKGRCVQDVECSEDSCEGTLSLGVNDTNCQPYFQGSLSHKWYMYAYQNKKDRDTRGTTTPQQLCEHTFKNSTCNLLDFKPTVVKINKHQDGSGCNVIDIEMRAPECLVIQLHATELLRYLQIQYRVDYWKVGQKESSLQSLILGEYEASLEGEDNTTQTLTLQLDEATLYIIQVHYLLPDILHNGYSRIRGPIVIPYLTAPCTAADIRPLRSDISFTCLPSNFNQSQLEISWKKSGQIDSGFTVIETRTKDGKLVKTTMQDVTPNNNILVGDNMRVNVTDYDPDMVYNVTVTSRNKAAQSPPSNAVLSYPVCQIRKDYRINNCSVVQTNSTSAVISWQSQSLTPQSYLLSIYDNIDQTIKDEEISPNITTTIMYQLKMCVAYQLTIHAKLDGQFVDRCVVNHMQLADEPDYYVHNITGTTAQIDMKDDCSQAQYEYTYKAHGRGSNKKGGKWTGASFNITDLIPYTDYKLNIRQIYVEKSGVYKESSFTTKEQAPSDAPGFTVKKTEYSKNDYNVTWTEPEITNGVVTLYILSVYNNKVSNRMSQCKKEGDDVMLCLFPNTTHTTRLNMSALTGVKMKACTQTVDDSESELCSEWSETYTIKFGQTTNYMWIVLLALGSSIPFIGMFCHYRYKSKNYHVQPKIDKEILDSFKLGNNNMIDTITVSYTPGGNQDDDDDGGEGENPNMDEEDGDPVDVWRRELKNGGVGASIKKKFIRQQSAGITSATGSGDYNVATTNEWRSAAPPYLKGFNLEQLDMVLTATNQINTDDNFAHMLPTTPPQSATQSTDTDNNETTKFLPTITQPSPIFPYKTLDVPPRKEEQEQVDDDMGNLDYLKDSDILMPSTPLVDNTDQPPLVMYEQDIFPPPQPTLFNNTDETTDTKGYTTSLNGNGIGVFNTTNNVDDDAAPLLDSYLSDSIFNNNMAGTNT